MSSGVPPASPRRARKGKTEVVVVPDTPRLLHRNPGTRSCRCRGKLTPNCPVHGKPRGDEAQVEDIGYTHQLHEGARDEPEPVDLEYQGKISADARRNYDLVHAEERARREVRSLKAQLHEAQARALKKGIDITPEMARVRLALEDAQRRLDAAA